MDVILKLCCDLDGVLHSPFRLDQLVDDFQEVGSGSCHVVSSVILAHAHQLNHTIAADDSHDSDELRAYLETRFNTLLRNGGVPSRAFSALLGSPIETLLLKNPDLEAAYQRVVCNGGVLPYIPSDVLQPHGLEYIVVFANELIACWNDMERADARWHSLAVLGIVTCPDNHYFLCKQSWQQQPKWILVPLITSDLFESNQDLWKVLTPVKRFMKDVYKVSSCPISLQDGSSEPPDSRADDPFTF
jgi:hypothetical protein